MSDNVYQKICETNKALFAELENLTNLIAFASAPHPVMGNESYDGDGPEVLMTEMERLIILQTEIDNLKQQKEGIRELINNNLDKLEGYWDVISSRARKVSRIDIGVVMTGMDKRVIEYYKLNPDITMQALGERYKISSHQSTRIITNYLTHKYAAA